MTNDHVAVACLVHHLRFETGKKYFTQFTLCFRHSYDQLVARDANGFRKQTACFFAVCVQIGPFFAQGCQWIGRLEIP